MTSSPVASTPSCILHAPISGYCEHALEESDVPANYIVRLRQEQAGLRKSLLSVYQIQREEFLPSAYAMIVSFVVMILTLLMLTKIHDRVETLVTLGFLSFFFLYLLPWSD